MSSVVDSVEESFKALVAEKPYRSITVKEICEGAFISRRTFYANFIDKRAVIAYLLRRDAIEPVSRALELISPEEMLDLAPILIARMYQGILDEADYYQSLVKPMAGSDATFELVAARALRNLITKQTLECNPNVKEDLLEFVSYYHAAGWALFMEKWIADGYKESPERLGELQAKLLLPSLAPLLDDSLLK